LIVCRDIHNAGEEALNAFLKNLEEPQENIYFALTAPSTRKVLPTIVSRCEVIRLIVTLRDNNLQFIINNEEAEKFIKLTTGEKLAYIDKIKDREKAIELAENLVNFLHSGLHENTVKYSVQAKNIEVAQKTLSGLKANGNVNLQLSNMVINLIY
jgi:DNA polymerase III delta prime subunit